MNERTKVDRPVTQAQLRELVAAVAEHFATLPHHPNVLTALRTRLARVLDVVPGEMGDGS